jgi:hypothetical protein
MHFAAMQVNLEVIRYFLENGTRLTLQHVLVADKHQHTHAQMQATPSLTS